MTRTKLSSLGAVISTWLALMPSMVLAALYPGLSNLNHTCALVKPELSCSKNAVFGQTDSCCSETYGGLVLSTQFWSTYTGLEIPTSPSAEPQLLPSQSWTIHGLWPDYCNGSYPEYCDLSRQYDPSPSKGIPAYPATSPDIGTFLLPFGRLDLLQYMNTYWVSSLGQRNADFWAHEFSKHGTCMSTFEKECYGPLYRPHEEIIDYFEATIKFFKQLPTYDWLAEANILPSNSTGGKKGGGYSLSKIQNTLTKKFGAKPYIGCSGEKYNETSEGKGSKDDGRVVLSEVWYYYHVYGVSQNGKGKPVDADSQGGRVTNCVLERGKVRYPERTKGSERTT
ncbi:Ribonuclease T2-like protein [Rhypophila decipiens]